MASSLDDGWWECAFVIRTTADGHSCEGAERLRSYYIAANRRSVTTTTLSRAHFYRTLKLAERGMKLRRLDSSAYSIVPVIIREMHVPDPVLTGIMAKGSAPGFVPDKILPRPLQTEPE